MKLPSGLAVLKNRDFRIYWLGQAVSLVGTWMQTMAQGWVVTSRSTSATVLGGLNIVHTLPMLLLGLKAGELADRHDKRRLLLATQVAMMVLAFVVAGLLFGGVLELWHIFALALLMGTVAAFELPVSQAFAPELVEAPLIPRAVGLMQAIFHGGRLVGPALAGFLIDRYGEGSAFAANGLSFLAVIASLLIIAPARGGSAPTRRGGNFREGINHVRTDPVMRALITLLGLTMAFVFPFMTVLLVFYVRHVLRAGPAEMGHIMSASGLGALTGSITLVMGARELWRARLWLGVPGLAGALAALSLNRSPLVAVGLAGVMSFSSSMVLGTVMQTAQERVPPALRGRVMALFGMAFTAVLPFSALLLSSVADAAGLPQVMGVCAGLFVLSGGALLLQLRGSPDPPAT